MKKKLVSASAIKPFLVEIKLGKNIIGLVRTNAVDVEKAKENAFVLLDFKVKKDYPDGK